MVGGLQTVEKASDYRGFFHNNGILNPGDIEILEKKKQGWKIAEIVCPEDIVLANHPLRKVDA